MDTEYQSLGLGLEHDSDTSSHLIKANRARKPTALKGRASIFAPNPARRDFPLRLVVFLTHPLVAAIGYCLLIAVVIVPLRWR
jgi:hypothetical protein